MKSKKKFLEIKMENESHGVFSATCGPLNLTIFFHRISRYFPIICRLLEPSNIIECF